jgi:homoserine dehydrogenase
VLSLNKIELLSKFGSLKISYIIIYKGNRMNPVKIGLLGLGTVGGGTATVLKRNAEEIVRRAGRGIIVDYVATLEPERADELELSDLRITQDAFKVVNDPDISIVVELIGGYSPAKELVLQAIENGKHVVTANGLNCGTW